MRRNAAMCPALAASANSSRVPGVPRAAHAGIPAGRERITPADDDIDWGADEPTPADTPDETARRRDSQATVLVRLATEARCDLWHTPAGDGHLTLTVNGHREHHPLTSRGARDYLARLYYTNSGTGRPMRVPCRMLPIPRPRVARFDGAEHPVAVRLAEYMTAHLPRLGGRHELAGRRDDQRRLAGRDESAVQFAGRAACSHYRSRTRGGSLTELYPFVNVASETDRVLLVAWELAALRGRGPFAILIFMAEPGAAKSPCEPGAASPLIDPNQSDLRRPPRNTEDFDDCRVERRDGGVRQLVTPTR